MASSNHLGYSWSSLFPSGGSPHSSLPQGLEILPRPFRGALLPAGGHNPLGPPTVHLVNRPFINNPSLNEQLWVCQLTFVDLLGWHNNQQTFTEWMNQWVQCVRWVSSWQPLEDHWTFRIPTVVSGIFSCMLLWKRNSATLPFKL